MAAELAAVLVPNGVLDSYVWRLDDNVSGERMA